MRPRSCTGTNDETIAPTPPRANFVSQLMRACVPEPSYLSKRPETFDLRMRFLIVRLRNLSGSKIASNAMALLVRPAEAARMRR